MIDRELANVSPLEECTNVGVKLHFTKKKDDLDIRYLHDKEIKVGMCKVEGCVWCLEEIQKNTRTMKTEGNFEIISIVS